MSSADAAVGAPERLHPLFLITGLGAGLRQVVGAWAAVGYFAATGSWRLAIMMLAGIAVVLVVGVILYWRRFEFRVGANEIRIDSGILNRTHRSIPFDRIQDVDISQGPLARLLGLARVRFETGGSAAAKTDDGALAAIALARAEAIRDQVRARRGVSAQAADAAEEDATPIFAMDLRRVLLAGMFNFSLAVIAGLFGLAQTFGDVAGFNFFRRRFWRDALDAGSPIADFFLAHQIASALAGAVLLVVVGLATGVGRTLLRDYRFRLDRTETGLRRRRGLFTLSDVTFPIKRAQAAVVGSSPLRERFGWRDLKLQSLGGDEGGKSGDHIVAPLASNDEIETILAELRWRGVDGDVEWGGVSSAYAWGFTLAVGLLLVPALIQSIFMPILGAIALVAIGIAIAGRWLAWRRYRFAVDGDRLLVRSGWWRRRIVILPLASIQSVDVVESFVSRSFGTASLAIGVASGRGYSNHGIAAVPRETARALRDRLLSHFA